MPLFAIYKGKNCFIKIVFVVLANDICQIK